MGDTWDLAGWSYVQWQVPLLPGQDFWRAFTHPFNLESSTGGGHLAPLRGSYRTLVKTGIVKSCQTSCLSLPKRNVDLGRLSQDTGSSGSPHQRLGRDGLQYCRRLLVGYPHTPKFCLCAVSRLSSLKCCFCCVSLLQSPQRSLEQDEIPFSGISDPFLLTLLHPQADRREILTCSIPELFPYPLKLCFCSSQPPD